MKGAATDDEHIDEVLRKPTRRRPTPHASAVTMWTLITSDGMRLTNIGSEADARRTVHTLGTTQLRGPFSWDVVNAGGRRFVAEIRHRAGGPRP